MKKLVLVFLLSRLVLSPVSSAFGYLAEDSFSPNWLERKKTQHLASVRSVALRYEVQRGDTLWGLAQVFHLNLETIESVNGLKKEAVIRPGQILILPCGGDKIHCVTPGETLWSLARRYQVDVVRLMAWNQIKDPTTLSVGKELVIPGQTSSRPQKPARGQKNGLTWPLLGVITSFFGPRKGEFHHGIDIAGELGDSVRAAQTGRVVFAGWRAVYGNTIILDHGNEIKTLYGHLRNFLVDTGDFVEKGEVIAHIGSSGRATGPHLHFEVRQNDRAINPLPYLGQ